MAAICEQVAEQLSDLLAGQVDALQAEALAAHLASCPACRVLAEEMVRQDLALAELAGQRLLPVLVARMHSALAAEAHPTGPAGTHPPQAAGGRIASVPAGWFRRVMPRRAGGLAAAAAGVLVAAGLLFWCGRTKPEASPPIGQLALVEGEVHVLTAEGRFPASPGRELLPGQGLQAGEEGRVVVVYPDATRLELGGNSTVRWPAAEGAPPAGPGRRVFLEEGVLAADVVPQEEKGPLVLVTPDAEIVVRGTRLSLVKRLDATHVETDQGLVEVTHRVTGRTVEVPAGFWAAVSPNVHTLRAQSIFPRFHEARAILNEPYGPHARNVLDLWLAASGRPTPLVVFIHAGRRGEGDKSKLPPALVQHCLRTGLSVASIEYRRPSETPLPAAMQDAARAVQFLRHRAGEWNLDPEKVAAVGQYNGGTVALWLAFHDDLADPAAVDPVARQSTRVACAGTFGARGSLDPRFIEKLVGKPRRETLWLLGLTPQNWDTPHAHALFEETSPITHASAGDPPVFLFYEANRDPLLRKDAWTPVITGEALFERLRSLGIETELRHGDDYQKGDWQEQMYGDMVAFLRRGLTPP